MTSWMSSSRNVHVAQPVSLLTSSGEYSHSWRQESADQVIVQRHRQGTPLVVTASSIKETCIAEVDENHPAGRIEHDVAAVDIPIADAGSCDCPQHAPALQEQSARRFVGSRLWARPSADTLARASWRCSSGSCISVGSLASPALASSVEQAFRRWSPTVPSMWYLTPCVCKCRKTDHSWSRRGDGSQESLTIRSVVVVVPPSMTVARGACRQRVLRPQSPQLLCWLRV